jgi:hypothetical protein
LRGYCSTPDYVLLDGPTAYWAPIVGCAQFGDKTGCCPYSVQKTAESATGTTVTVIATVTVDVSPGGTAGVAYTGNYAYPQPQSSQDATLQHCPDDYVTVPGPGCCPS